MKKVFLLFAFIAFIVAAFMPASTKICYADSAEDSAQIMPNDRTAFSSGERVAAKILAQFFDARGLDAFDKNYTLEFASYNKQSQNVVAKRFSNHSSEKFVLIGAHYDNIFSANSNGYADNLSGVTALMKIATHPLSSARYNVVFAFWGAEEEGHLGSSSFASTYKKQMENCILYINLDSVALGDVQYYYLSSQGDEYEPLAAKLGLNKYSDDLSISLSRQSENLFSSIAASGDSESFIDTMPVLSIFSWKRADGKLTQSEFSNVDKISHVCDTIETAEKMMGDYYDKRIESAVSFTLGVLLDNVYSFTPINTMMYSLLAAMLLLAFCSLLIVLLRAKNGRRTNKEKSEHAKNKKAKS